MMFQPGQLVVCVDDAISARYLSAPAHAYRGNLGGLSRGRVYRVRGYSPEWTARFQAVRSIPVVWLEEIVRTPDDPYHAARFRPVQDSRLDVFRTTTAPVEREPA